MSKRNREKRAAKKRQRQAAGARRSRMSDPFGGVTGAPDPFQEFFAPPPSVFDQITAAISGFTCAVEHDGLEARRAAVGLRSDFTGQERQISAAVEAFTDGVLAALWKAGWQPVDVHNAVGREVDALARAFLVDRIAAEALTYAEARVDVRWRRQLAEIGAEVWWTDGVPYLRQLAGRHSGEGADALTAALAVLAKLTHLHPIEQLLPPPGTATAAQSQVIDEAQAKVLAKVRGLLAKAESTEFPEEAETLSAKAQELMSRYALERALVDAERGDAPETSGIRLWLDRPYVPAKAALVRAVAEANRCRAVRFKEWDVVTVVGDPVDVRSVELLTTSLLVQATRAMVAKRASGNRTRSFRQSFLIAFAGRIGERLREATAASVAEAADDRLLPVLASRKQAVDERFAALFPKVTTTSMSISNGEGWAAGKAAADLAQLDVHGALPRPSR